MYHRKISFNREKSFTNNIYIQIAANVVLSHAYPNFPKIFSSLPDHCKVYCDFADKLAIKSESSAVVSSNLSNGNFSISY